MLIRQVTPGVPEWISTEFHRWSDAAEAMLSPSQCVLFVQTDYWHVEPMSVAQTHRLAGVCVVTLGCQWDDDPTTEAANEWRKMFAHEVGHVEQVLKGLDITEPPAEWRDEWESYMLKRLAKHLKTTAGITTPAKKTSRT